MPGVAANRSQIETLCREAAEHHFASVCVNPMWVPLCVSLLRGSGVEVCTVVGFPLGANESEIKALETRRAVQQGATEIDLTVFEFNAGAIAFYRSLGYETRTRRMSKGLD